jgi:SAM-dependent MidA family methyltransferase
MWDVSRRVGGPRSQVEGVSVGQAVPWREAMASALYGPGGFFTGRAGSAQFRTSATASPLFASAILRLLAAVDRSLGTPDPLVVVDVGAGTARILTWLDEHAPAGLRERLRLEAVDLAPAIPGVSWSSRLPPPGSVTGLVLATEWLDNVPLDIAEVDDAGAARYVLVDRDSGTESLGDALTATDAAWAERWWPDRRPGSRIELGAARDEAWSAAVAGLARGLALTVDYGHTVDGRPLLGTLTGFAGGRECAPVPDGSCDITAHVAVDAVRTAGEAVAGRAAELMTQRDALTRLGVSGARPPRELALTDPAGYVRALASASQAAELMAREGLGHHIWLAQPVSIFWPGFTSAVGMAR